MDHNAALFDAFEGTPLGKMAKVVNEGRVTPEMEIKRQAVRRVFGTPEGKIVLGFLREHTIDAPETILHIPDGQAASNSLWYHYGQNSVVKMIEQWIRQGET